VATVVDLFVWAKLVGCLDVFEEFHFVRSVFYLFPYAGDLQIFHYNLSTKFKFHAYIVADCAVFAFRVAILMDKILCAVFTCPDYLSWLEVYVIDDWSD
jgi:hypothetical protein